MICETQRKGLETELHCIQDLTKIGIETLTPMQGSCKYDVVADLDGKFIRIQCKHSVWCNDTAKEKEAFAFKNTRSTTNTKGTTIHSYSEKDIDYFYTWFNGHGYLVSIKEANNTAFRFRYVYPDTGQHKKIHIASDYEIEKVINRLIKE